MYVCPCSHQISHQVTVCDQAEASSTIGTTGITINATIIKP